MAEKQWSRWEYRRHIIDCPRYGGSITFERWCDLTIKELNEHGKRATLEENRRTGEIAIFVIDT